MAKKKAFELVGVGTPTKSSGIPVTYTFGGGLMTVYVFGLHPSNVVDRDDDDCNVVEDRELAENSIKIIESLWQWFDQQRDEAVASYVRDLNEQERLEKRTAASGGQPSKPVIREELLEACRTEL